jgi:hypothetical protein
VATKPDIDDARWAEESDGTPSAGITEPASGKKDLGWVAGEKPPAQYFNHILNAGFQWDKYLDEGEIDYVELFTTTPYVRRVHASGFSYGTAWEFAAAAAVAGSLLKLTSADAIAEHPLNELVVGDLIGGVRWTFDTDGNDVRIQICRIAMSDGTVTVVNDADYVGGSFPAGRRTEPGQAVTHTVLADHWYVVRVRASDNGSVFYGGEIQQITHPR